MRKKNNFEEFLRRLEEAVRDMQDEDISYRPIFIDVSINVYPNMGVLPADIYFQADKMPIDILETEKNIHAVVGLPGMEKGNIGISCNGRILEVTACNAEKAMKDAIELPARVIKKGMKVTFENGILEVIFNKAKKKSSNKSKA